ncbi:MAG: SpoIIE family protein phosphatase [Lachnospiraceae bacterium]|nr:SpoIIE family protein phosphatase [Lachnospiraceae bacterium]
MSIKKKVSSLTIKVSLVSVIIIGVIAIAGLWILRENTVHISGELGGTAAHDSQAALEKQMTDRLLTLAENMALLSDSKLRTIQNSVQMIAYSAEDILHNPDNYTENPALPPNPANAGMMAAQFLHAENVDLTAVMKEAALMGNIEGILLNILRNNINAVHNNTGSANNYIGSELGYIILADDSSDNKSEFFEPRERPWYQLAAGNNALSWSDVYADAYGRGLAITCAMPYYDKDGHIAGVAGLGSLLNELTEIVNETKIGETGYAFISNEKDEIIISDMVTIEDGVIIRRELMDLLPTDTAIRIRDSSSGLERIQIGGEDYFIAYSSLETLPWNLVTVIEVSEAIAPALQSSERIIDMTKKALNNIDVIIITIIISFIVIIVITILIIRYTSQKFAGKLTNPITELTDGAIRIGKGDLDHMLLVKTGDEIETLSDTFNSMIAGIKSITAEKERIGAELDVATKIQASMLPCIFPAFPDRSEFDIYATMIPAKEVGGDFYDFFMIDENKLAVVIADVSGKGVPAALFMVIAKTLLKNNAQYGKNPKEVFELVNNLLCENNEAQMFVTAFMGFLDIPSGTFTYVNAGHNPPLIKRAGGDYEWLNVLKPGFVLAGMEDMVYRQGELNLSDGDMLFLYTDGVTEAVNAKNELFSDPRLLEAANRHKSTNFYDFIAQIISDIFIFAYGAEQADDITMLVLKITGGAE